jgi:hypothetical protein
MKAQFKDCYVLAMFETLPGLKKLYSLPSCDSRCVVSPSWW